MKRLLVLVLTLIISSAMAVNWSSVNSLQIVNDKGEVIGKAEVERDEVEIDLLKGYQGDIRVIINGKSYIGTVKADGKIYLMVDDAEVDMARQFRNAGVEYSVDRKDDINDIRDNDDSDDNDDNDDNDRDDNDNDDNDRDDNDNDDNDSDDNDNDDNDSNDNDSNDNDSDDDDNDDD